MIGTKIYRLFEKMSYDPFEQRATFTDANGKVWVEQRPRTPWVSSVVEYEVISYVEVKISGSNVEELMELMPWEDKEFFTNRYVLKSTNEEDETAILSESEMSALQNGDFQDFYLNQSDAEKEVEKRNETRKQNE